MSFLWESVKQMSQLAGAAALLAGQKTKIRGEVMLTEREMKTRQQIFGVELYDYVAPLAKSPDFFAANDQMTDTIRGPFLAAQREIAALMIKRSKLKEELAQAEVTRRAAFPQPATTFGEQVLNTGKATAFTAHEVKIKTEIGMVDAAIKSHKEEFGEAMFATFVKLEDEQGWLPTVRDIRSMYDKARQDVDKLKLKINAKEKELQTLGTEADVAAREFTTTATTAPTTTAAAPQPAVVVAPVHPLANPATSMPTTTNTTTFGSFPASYAPPAPAPAPPAQATTNFGSFSDSTDYRPPPAVAPGAAASGLFLGLDGSGSSSHSGSSSGIGISQRRQKQQQQQQQLSSSSSLAHDPFSSSSSNGFPSSAPNDPFSTSSNGSFPSSAPPLTANDPFAFTTAQPQHQAAKPYDPFAFTQSSQQQQPSSLPYDPFSNSSTTSATTNSSNYNDPFADLVAGGGGGR